MIPHAMTIQACCSLARDTVMLKAWTDSAMYRNRFRDQSRSFEAPERGVTSFRNEEDAGAVFEGGGGAWVVGVGFKCRLEGAAKEIFKGRVGVGFTFRSCWTSNCPPGYVWPELAKRHVGHASEPEFWPKRMAVERCVGGSGASYLPL